MQNRPLTEIFTRYLQNRCSPDEVREIIQHFSADDETGLRQLIKAELERDEPVADAHLQLISQEVLAQLKSTLADRPQLAEPVIQPVRRTLWRQPWFAAAACMILLLGAGVYFLLQQKTVSPKPPEALAAKPAPDTLAPAANKAVLILSTGKQINLDNAQAGRLATDAYAIINKSADGKLEYETMTATGGPAAEPAYNTLTTPRGGRYDLTLSDGTRVSLNAASSIRYPSAFTGKSRDVEITGEVYFEVVHDAGKPFRVSAAGQLIEDLGTRFNVNAYSDEPSLTTTLLEGSVRVSTKSRSALLRPGQQAVIRAGRALQVNQDADLDEVMAWQRGLFTFHDADIQTVMRQLSRWYDVDISYEGAVPQRRFSGKIYRNISAQKVADILQYKQIHFRIEGRSIIVMP